MLVLFFSEKKFLCFLLIKHYFIRFYLLQNQIKLTQLLVFGTVLVLFVALLIFSTGEYVVRIQGRVVFCFWVDLFLSLLKCSMNSRKTKCSDHHGLFAGLLTRGNCLNFFWLKSCGPSNHTVLKISWSTQCFA